MFIETEETPNPATIKFLPGREVVGGDPANFASVDEAETSPLARRIFGISGVTQVFLGNDFISVSKTDGQDWFRMKPAVLGAIMDHFMSGEPAVLGTTAKGDAAEDEDDDDIVVQIKELLDTRVRPAVAQDGGDILFHGFVDGIVYLHMQGACAGCPSSTATLKMGIEQLLKHYVPEVIEVRAVA